MQVTLCKIGDQCIVDPTSAEEKCSGGALVVAVSRDTLSTILLTGGGSLHPSTLQDSLSLGYEVAQNLDKVLLNTLSDINNTSDVGFLN